MKLNTQALSQVQIGTPVLQPGPYFCKIKALTLKEQKGGQGNNLNVVLQIMADEVTGYDQKKYKNNNGEFNFFDRFSLVTTDEYNPNKKLKEINLAAGVDGDDFDTEVVTGQYVKVQVKYVPTQTGKDGVTYNERNQISSYHKIQPSDNFNAPVY